jgi:1-acyl-sn-glycerol-3-phosphate acyltransferase
MCQLVDTEKPQEKDSRFYRWVTQNFCQLAMWVLLMRVHKTGMKKLPQKGRYLLVCNHLGNLDPGIPLTVFPDAQLAFISKKENRDMPIIGPLMPKIQCQYIDRENDRAALKTILKCISILKEDKANIGVFPEGYVIRDGKLLHHFRPGVFKIAQKANVPIVVCTINGTQNMKANGKAGKKTDVHFHLLEVIPADELKGIPTTQIAERVHAIMAADLGAENVAD